MFNKAHFKTPKHQHQITFETLKFPQLTTMFWNRICRWKCNKLS